MITPNFDHLHLHPGDRVLDIGCGTGRHTCATYKKAGVVAIGADLDLEDVREAKNRLELHDRLGIHGGGRWGLCVADSLHLPFDNAAFDLIVCCEVLEHIRDHRTAVTELARVLKPGHQLVVSVPRYWPEKICWSISKTYSREKGGHIRIYRKSSIVEILRCAGFKLRAVHYAHSLHTPYWWLKCLIGLEHDEHQLVRLYHRFLTWDIMQRPWITGFIERLINPILGKSIVLYLVKSSDASSV